MLNLRESVSYGLFPRLSVAACILVGALSGLASDIRGYKRDRNYSQGESSHISQFKSLLYIQTYFQDWILLTLRFKLLIVLKNRHEKGHRMIWNLNDQSWA